MTFDEWAEKEKWPYSYGLVIAQEAWDYQQKIINNKDEIIKQMEEQLQSIPSTGATYVTGL